jgi:hypothetical protein
MTQKELDNINGYISDAIQHYTSGLLTALEFKQVIDRIGVMGDLSGLLDSATGLRYPK